MMQVVMAACDLPTVDRDALSVSNLQRVEEEYRTGKITWHEVEGRLRGVASLRRITHTNELAEEYLRGKEE